MTEIYCRNQGSRLPRPSMLNTRSFRFGRKFQLSVRPSGREFYEFRLAGSVDMQAIYITLKISFIF